MLDMDGFQEGYLTLDKEAFWEGSATAGAMGVGSVVSTAGKAKALALLIPVLVGVGAGASVSKLTSPSATDTDNMQKSILAGEMEEALAELRRKKEFATEETEATGPSPREIRF